MARLRKTIPKEFVTFIKEGDETAARELFTRCEPQAKAPLYGKPNALACPGLSKEMMQWLLEQGVG